MSTTKTEKPISIRNSLFFVAPSCFSFSDTLGTSDPFNLIKGARIYAAKSNQLLQTGTQHAANVAKNDYWICNDIKKHQSSSEGDVSGSSVE